MRFSLRCPNVLLTAIVWLAAGSVLAQTDAATQPTHTIYQPPLPDALEAQAQTLGHHLRCPVCQGMPISESPATMAVDMMQQVRRMLADGMTQAQIDAYFVERYGQWVLLDPPKRGFTLWAWLLPPMLFVVALLLFWRFFSGQRTQKKPEKSGQNVPTPAPSSVWLQNVRDEVEQ